MNALAMLTGRFSQRTRAAVEPPGTLAVRLQSRDFLDSVTRGWPNVAVVDPTVADNCSRLATCLRKAHLGTVFYIRLTPTYACALVQFLREMDARVVTFGYNDDPQTLARVLRSAASREYGTLLLQRLANGLALLPTHIRHGIERFNDRAERVESVPQLACYCSVSDSTLNLHLHKGGLATAKCIVAGLALVRAYDVLSDPDTPLCQAALSAGVASARALDRRCYACSGLRLRELRNRMTLDELITCVASRISTTAPRREE